MKQTFALYSQNHWIVIFYFFLTWQLKNRSTINDYPQNFSTVKILFTRKSLIYRATHVVQPFLIVHVKVAIPVAWKWQITAGSYLFSVSLNDKTATLTYQDMRINVRYHKRTLMKNTPYLVYVYKIENIFFFKSCCVDHTSVYLVLFAQKNTWISNITHSEFYFMTFQVDHLFFNEWLIDWLSIF